jgi:hypothetical protein
MTTNAPAKTNGSTWYVRWVGNHRWIEANSTRPTVTIAQNVVRATAAVVVEAPSSVVMSSCDQLPFIVSQMPYSTAKAAYHKKRDGIVRSALPSAPARAPVCKGRRRLTASSAARRMAESTGSPHQKPRPTNSATNTGARAVPSPSNAFNVRIERSMAAGWNVAVRVLRVGTVSPKPAPRNAVATRSNP